MENADGHAEESKSHDAAGLGNGEMQEFQEARTKEVVKRRLKHLEAFVCEWQRFFFHQVADVVHVAGGVEAKEYGEKGGVVNEEDEPHCGEAEQG